MSSIHRLPPEEVASKVLANNQPIGDVIAADDNEINGKAFGKCFETIHIFADESVVIASDSLHGIHQNGFVTKYDRIEDVPQMPVLSLAPDFGGICNLFALRDKRLICGFDSGHISVLNEELEEQMAVIYHDNQINGLHVNRLETKSVSCGYDMTLLVLDLETFMPYKCYNYAHSDIIWDIEFSPQDDSLVLSCGRDKDVLLWDLTKAKPASRVATLTADPTALCWSTKEISTVYIGTDCGQVKQFDVRQPGKEVMAFTPRSDGNESRVHRIKNIFGGNSLAICCDDNVLRVLDSEDLICVYDKSLHTDWVRDVTQHNKSIYSVGKDSRLVHHSELDSVV